ncbi:MAG: glycosyltransferase family 2 protein [Polyangiaceae bacterium]
MLTGVASFVLLGAGAILAIPVATFGAECLIGALAQRRTERRMRPVGTRAVILMPAHNEERGIFGTVSALRGELGPLDGQSWSSQTIVRTAPRRLPVLLGRPYSSGSIRPKEGRDTRCVSPSSNSSCGRKNRTWSSFSMQIVGLPQAVSMLWSARLSNGTVQSSRRTSLRFSEDADTKTRIGAFAFRVKNSLRPRGLARLGLPRQLAGTGMAFPWPVLRDAPNMRGHITEDLVLGLELAFLGYPPYECPEAGVYSEIAPSTQGQYAQRQRWEYGHLMAIRD